jgi:fructuronate reductase
VKFENLSMSTLRSRQGQPHEFAGPAVDPRATTIGIVHFGIGAFHRSHQAVYTEDAAAAAEEARWGILGVTGRAETVVEQLRPQDCLYGVLTKGATTTSLRIVGAVVEVAWPGRDSERVVEVLADPETHIATLTITEKGYLRDADGRIDLDLPAVRHDLALVEGELADSGGPDGTGTAGGPGSPLSGAWSAGGDSSMSRSPIGLLVRGLARRYRSNGAPFTVLPCDNLVDNGIVTHRIVVSLVAAIRSASDRDGFLAWLEQAVTFPSTMVDRITPAVTDADRVEAGKLSGLHDEALVVAEPFSQWVIEDRFAGPRPAWEKVGAILTDDVLPYERVKLRVLNATHSLLAYLGALKGLDTIAEAVADPALLRTVREVLDHDILPTLAPAPGLNLESYRDTVLERFANTALAHTTRQVAMDGSQKLPNRLLGTVVDRLAAGHVPAGLALAVAAWIAYLASTLAENGPVLDDPLADRLAAVVGSADAIETSAEGLVARVLALREIFPAEIADSGAFQAAIVAQFPRVRHLTAAPPLD